MRIPRPELVSEELDYHRRQVEVLTALLAISKQHHAERRATKRVLQRKRTERHRDRCGCANDQRKTPCGKCAIGSSR